MIEIIWSLGKNKHYSEVYIIFYLYQEFLSLQNNLLEKKGGMLYKVKLGVRNFIEGKGLRWRKEFIQTWIP